MFIILLSAYVWYGYGSMWSDTDQWMNSLALKPSTKDAWCFKIASQLQILAHWRPWWDHALCGARENASEVWCRYSGSGSGCRRCWGEEIAGMQRRVEWNGGADDGVKWCDVITEQRESTCRWTVINRTQFALSLNVKCARCPFRPLFL